ncbi:MAG TPA: hypothetical protein VNX46_06150, partial [Candidatus Acidoferrum sp.]|nr:hypothetical protein [Candidatus Acidoferrum sp.]
IRLVCVGRVVRCLAALAERFAINMTRSKAPFVGMILCAFLQMGFSQGFVNLDFENPLLPLTPVYFEVPASDGIPGWTAYVGGNQVNQIVYNTRPLDAAEVTLQGPGSSILTPIECNYTVELYGSSRFEPPQSAAIGQTGQIPANARSLTFWGYSPDVSFGGQALSLVLLGTTPNYDIYGADISSFAGQTGQLLFTAQPQSLGIIDNIQFSASPVPEPNSLGWFALGGLFVAWRHWQPHHRRATVQKFRHPRSTLKAATLVTRSVEGR